MTAKHERPFLYVLATSPSTPNQSTTSEWIIEVNKPQPTGLKPLSTVTRPKYSKHHVSNSQKSRMTSSPEGTGGPSSSIAAAEPSSSTAMTVLQPTTPSVSQRTFFSRLHPQPTTSSIEAGSSRSLVLRIAVASIPYQHSHQITSDLESECAHALESVHTTPDPASWLRQALLALQGKAVLPPVSHDFDVTKFLNIAEEYLERTLRTKSTVAATATAEDGNGNGNAAKPPREVKYWKLLRGEAPGDSDDADGDERKGEDADDEDDQEDDDDEVDGAHGANVANDWSLPHRERKSVSERGAGSTPAAGGFSTSRIPTNRIGR